jgi:hypothetical protein
MVQKTPFLGEIPITCSVRLDDGQRHRLHAGCVVQVISLDDALGEAVIAHCGLTGKLPVYLLTTPGGVREMRTSRAQPIVSSKPGLPYYPPRDIRECFENRVTPRKRSWGPLQ